MFSWLSLSSVISPATSDFSEISKRDDSATADMEMYVLDACNDEIDTNEAGFVQDLKNAKENIASANDPVLNVV